MREHHHRPCKEATTSHVFELPGIQEVVFGEVSEKGIFLLREHAHHTGNGVTAVVLETFEAEKKGDFITDEEALFGILGKETSSST